MSNSSVSFVQNLTTGISPFLNLLSQNQTNGASLWGTPEFQGLPLYLPQPGTFETDSIDSTAFPWGAKTTNNSSPYSGAPTTNVTTRHYDFVIERGLIAPDGYEKSVILINGQFPGPLIEANWGDTIEVTVTNNIAGPEEGTALHWHGLPQNTTQWEDGVPAVQQCPIPPNATFTYSFPAVPYGSTWYHSHYSAQYAGGLLGPMVIYGPYESSYDVDLGPILISDYYHDEYFDILENVMSTNASVVVPTSGNNLINGKMDYDCSILPNNTKSNCTPHAGLSSFNFTSGLTHRLRLINSGAEALQYFSIDNHTMTVIANDFVPVQPYNTTFVTLGIGQRTDVLVTGTGNPDGKYWMRSNMSTTLVPSQHTNCSSTNQPFALAAVFYEEANRTLSPDSIAWEDNGDIAANCSNQPLEKTVPSYEIPASTDNVTTQVIQIDLHKNDTLNTLWWMNNVSFRADYNAPVLLEAFKGNDSYPFDPEWNVYDFGTNKSIRLIVNNNSPVAHPMHLHGHNFLVLAEGPEFYGPDNVTFTNTSNPQRRDVQMLQAWGFTVFQFENDNPGVWPFHCHIAWHVSAGLYINVMERAQEIPDFPIPESFQQNCQAWNTYTSTHVVDQIDSGE